jgi:hypothetical protein
MQFGYLNAQLTGGKIQAINHQFYAVCLRRSWLIQVAPYFVKCTQSVSVNIENI